MTKQGNGKKWAATKEKILLFSGLGIFAVELMNAEILGGSFHYEFLIAALALAGISATSWGDKK